MPSYFRHIVHFLLVAMMLMSITSCARWREAKAVIAEADRLLGEGVIMRDTAALADVIKALDNPIGRVIAREELTEAYYLMGRNLDDYCRDFATAADYYIEADRLQTKELVLRGRINSCMGFICKQDSCFKEALEFYERANEAFYESDDERRYAIGLLSIAEQHINLKEYAQADSILQIADNYEIDSAYYAMLLETKGIYFFGLQQYDSALTYLLSIENYPRPIEAKCYSYMKIMQIYIRQNNYKLADRYACFIIEQTKTPNYKTNAYYTLLRIKEKSNDSRYLANLSYLRKDKDVKIRYESETYAQAAIKLKAYLDNPYPYLLINWCIFCSMVAILSLCIVAYTLHKRNQGTSHKTTEILRLQEEKSIADRKLFERQIFDYSVHFTSIDAWKDSHKLREQANIYCGNIFYRLEENYHLSEQDIKICLMVLLDFSREQMANYLYVQPNTISKAKNKIAKQLGTSSAQLREFLITFLA